MLRQTARYRAYSAAAANSRLHGTVIPHDLYVFLHSAVSPMEAPSRLDSPIRAALQAEVTKLNGIVNFSWAKEQPIAEQPDRHKITAYSRPGGRLELEISGENMAQEVTSTLWKHARGEAGEAQDESNYAIDFYVCTHKERDCRCGEHGYAVAEALRTEVTRRKESGSSNSAHRIRTVGETTHVGGHKYAANVLIYPFGDWLGNVRPEHVPTILDEVLKRPFLGPPSETEGDPPILPELWRGRMGLTNNQQVEMYEKYVSQQ
ncbi:hypothetical protein OE88DRAFT_1631029 [Heliocybe sulcata]|uniref:Sucraseferredoxin-like protein n=1 Tax=Heliocybe sulcata TaxID=5364 RepID=A0A5C3N907_9AGAM|nr:hypothetical protein OE88DRAFT_1631029 [Heliocybe sulcata]